jgi:serine/threonine protein kinase
MNTYTGTIAFRAPEMFEKVCYNESIDMWAAGCVLYIMLSGKEPFYSKFMIDLIDKIENCSYDFKGKNWKYISNEAQDLIKKLL